MKRQLLFIVTIIFFTINAKSQIEQGHWMVGGSGSYSIQTQNINGVTLQSSVLKISPNVGYFLLNRFCAGVNLGTIIYNTKDKGPVAYTAIDSKYYLISPFVRYYFFSADKPYNLFSQLAYIHQSDKVNILSGSNDNGMAFSGGCEFFFNASVGIELSANYQFINSNNLPNTNTFFIGIGFQIHLETERNFNKHH